MSLSLGSGRSPRIGNGNPLQYSCLENLMDTGSWWVSVHGVAVRHNWAHTEIRNDVLGFYLFVFLEPALSCLWAFAYAFPLTWKKVPFSSDSSFSLGFLSRHYFLQKAFLDTPSFPKPQVCIDGPSYGFPGNLVFPISIESLSHPSFFKLPIILSFLSYFLWGQTYVHLVPKFPSRALAATSSWHKKFIQ